ncbi:MAG TPA: DUF505 domain-containing protein [Ktedonobacteraceae bacterium]|nr:DUF505 domain-containing protein [Ktedonobacteraceae bacterium]
MLITTAHLLVLHELGISEAAGQAVRTLAEDEPRGSLYRELELQGLMALEPPRSYRLTYAGREALGLFDAMQQAALVASFDQLEKDWRFLGSDILAALQAAEQNKGRVGPLTETMLSTRGFAEQAHDSLEKTSFSRLNKHGEAWLDFARRYRSRLEITGDLANSIHHMHPGYTGRPDLQMPAEHITLLEAMDLLAWSVPERSLYALSVLGQAVYEAVRKGGYAPLDAVLDEPILEVLALFIDRGSASLTDSQVTELQMLGYVDLEGRVSSAGQAAMQAYALLQRERPKRAPTFAITEPEGELLATIHQLNEPARGAGRSPDKKALHRVLVDRMAKRYQNFMGRYGRMVREKSARKRQALAMLEQMKEHDKWFGTFWDLDELLVGLEAFDLLRAEGQGPETVYRLTPNGQSIVLEQEGEPRDITATAVKALTASITRFQALADPWVEQAREEGLIGTGGITRSGHFYAGLAKHCPRTLKLTQTEATVLVNLPETGREISTFSAKEYSSPDEEKEAWACEKLEAFGLVNRLVDGQIVRTETGELLAKAVSGALSLAHPVTPTLLRVLAAIRQVGTLYAKERKVRIQPHAWEEAERLTGLSPQEFREAVHIARLGHYLGETTLTEAGLTLLEVQEHLKSIPA